ncbi:hypothetical protein A3F06_03100 [candidate division TM6 bacterium RIFCSPHIGHO2_12_FULL_36_22]|nr:MAG: hypothetical protein A3F06_03100 [candidate division TM6 bacterium RIFCSPHIGHO2_12_FULL_36_22]
MFKKFILLLLLVAGVKAHQHADWCILLYMDGMQDLEGPCFKNITEIIRGVQNDNVQIFVQLHAEMEKKVAHRYRVEPNKLVFDSYVDMAFDMVQDLADSAQWAFSQCKAHHNGVILWDHGFGILDPQWQENDEGKMDWLAEADEPIGRRLRFVHPQSSEHVKLRHKGILFNNAAQYYMTNDQMVAAFAKIYTILGGKKLDILGTDTCGMSMLEIGWQLRDYVEHLVGAQNCEELDGWPYKAIFETMSSDIYSPKQVCQIITDEYNSYHIKKAQKGVYTKAALDLSHMEEVKQSLDEIVVELQKEISKEKLKKIVYDARSNCTKFCINPLYTDLWTLYEEIGKNLDSDGLLSTNLNNKLNDGKKAIEVAVVANATGKLMQRAHGISVYMPFHHIDSSYKETMFAHDSQWLSFMEYLLSPIS